jgi:hypothetical protein
MCDAMGATNSVVAGASGGGKTAEMPGQMPGQMPPVAGGGGGNLADLLPQLEGIMTALKALVEKLGGGAAAAVAGASGDVAAGGPTKDAKSGANEVANANGGPIQAPPTKVAGDSGPGQVPTQEAPGKVAGDSGPGGKVTQTDVGGVFQHGFGHQLRRGRGHHRHMGGFQFPGQFTGQFPAPGKAPVTQVAGASAPGKVEQAPTKVDAPVTQVAGDSGPGKVEQAPTKVEAPVTQVAGDTGSGKDDVPVKSEPVQSEPTQSAPTQVAGDSGSEPKAPVVSQSEPVQSAPAKPVVGDVKLMESDASNVMLLEAADSSWLYFNGSNVQYRTRTGVAQTMDLPASGFALTLSDGTKVSYGMYDKDAWGEAAGTPRDLEVLSPDGELLATRTDDGESPDYVSTPLTSFHLLEIATQLWDGTYAKFGGDSSDVAQKSDSVVQQTAAK